jgi:hypothetical protein
LLALGTCVPTILQNLIWHIWLGGSSESQYNFPQFCDFLVDYRLVPYNWSHSHSDPDLKVPNHHHHTRFRSHRRAVAMEEWSPKAEALYGILKAEMTEEYEANRCPSTPLRSSSRIPSLNSRPSTSPSTALGPPLASRSPWSAHCSARHWRPRRARRSRSSTLPWTELSILFRPPQWKGGVRG